MPALPANSMRGICGVIDWTESPDATALVRRMTPTMFHRGPDDEGYLDGERLSIGMRRLSIIYLAGGHQPIFNEDGTVGAMRLPAIYPETPKLFLVWIPCVVYVIDFLIVLGLYA